MKRLLAFLFALTLTLVLALGGWWFCSIVLDQPSGVQLGGLCLLIVSAVWLLCCKAVIRATNMIIITLYAVAFFNLANDVGLGAFLIGVVSIISLVLTAAIWTRLNSSKGISELFIEA